MPSTTRGTDWQVHPDTIQRPHSPFYVSNQHNSNYASHILNTRHTPQTIHLKQTRLLRKNTMENVTFIVLLRTRYTYTNRTPVLGVLIHDEHWQQCHHSSTQTVATKPTYNHVTQHSKTFLRKTVWHQGTPNTLHTPSTLSTYTTYIFE